MALSVEYGYTDPDSLRYQSARREAQMINRQLSPGISTVLERLSDLKQQHYTGKLIISGSSSCSWTLYIFMGRLLYGTGGRHPVRRWCRQVLAGCPNLTPRTLKDWLKAHRPSAAELWEYDHLCSLVAQDHLTCEQAARIVHSILTELFSDLAQVWRLDCKTVSGFSVQKQLMLLDPVRFVEQQEPTLERMQAAKVTDYPFDCAPVVRQPAQLKEVTSESVYQTLSKLLNGQNTFWDLSVLMKRPIVDVVSSLVLFIQAELIELREVADLPAPTMPIAPQPEIAGEQPLIACVDDSAWMCQTLETVVAGAGYRFLGIQDPLRAIPTLLSQKPALILLDLRMPNTNGYEICSQLRRLSAFTDTPIVILTGNDGIVDRVRAKMVGATDFLSKSVEHVQLLAVLDKYLTVQSGQQV
ncbi:MAG: response regulator [Aphanocapsa sp. GSE-SYN-MK-11-07L]|jgi:chemotaxis family two-component system response regulator PixG|nr:response regulator [Aphanocapsa sp. GSE-SYN-MK-11-07L]